MCHKNFLSWSGWSLMWSWSCSIWTSLYSDHFLVNGYNCCIADCVTKIFLADQDEVWCEVKAVQSEHPYTVILIWWMEITAVLLIVSQKINIGLGVVGVLKNFLLIFSHMLEFLLCTLCPQLLCQSNIVQIVVSALLSPRSAFRFLIGQENSKAWARLSDCTPIDLYHTVGIQRRVSL